MSTATLQQKKTTPAAAAPEKLENGVPTAARPAPAPADDEELRKEADAVEKEEETQEGVHANTEPPETEEEEEEDAVSQRLFGAAQEITNEIEECQSKIQKANETADTLKATVESEYKVKLDKIEDDRNSVVEEAEARSEELKSQFQSALTKMQSAFGVAPKQIRRLTAKPAGKTRQPRSDKSIRSLILDHLEKHRHSTTKEIRAFLQAQGRTTNPGVELSRMVKDGSIINKERGMYTVGKARK